MWYDHRDETAADTFAAVREGRNGIGTLDRTKLRATQTAEQAEAHANTPADTSRAAWPTPSVNMGSDS